MGTCGLSGADFRGDSYPTKVFTIDAPIEGNDISKNIYIYIIIDMYVIVLSEWSLTK